MIGLYFVYNSIVDILIVIIYFKYFNKIFIINKGKINFSLNCDDVCFLKFFNRILFLIFNKIFDKLVRVY